MYALNAGSVRRRFQRFSERNSARRSVAGSTHASKSVVDRAEAEGTRYFSHGDSWPRDFQPGNTFGRLLFLLLSFLLSRTCLEE